MMIQDESKLGANNDIRECMHYLGQITGQITTDVRYPLCINEFKKFKLKHIISDIMSSKMEITRICQFCGNEFIARKTVTKYCSLKCASKAYKQKQRESKIKNSNKETLSKPNSTDLSILKDREYFTVSKAALLLGISRATMYRYLTANIIKSLVIRGKTFVRRQDIDALFENAGPYQTRVR